MMRLIRLSLVCAFVFSFLPAAVAQGSGYKVIKKISVLAKRLGLSQRGFGRASVVCVSWNGALRSSIWRRRKWSGRFRIRLACTGLQW